MPAPDPHALAYAVTLLRSEGDDKAADALMERYGQAEAEPDEPAEPVAKAMSACADSAGGTLVAPAGGPVPKKKRKRTTLARVLKGLTTDHVTEG